MNVNKKYVAGLSRKDKAKQKRILKERKKKQRKEYM